MKYEYTILNDDEIMSIHESSLRVLYNVGMRVYDDKFCSTLSKKGFIVDRGQQLVRFPKEMIDTALKVTPESFSMYDHKGNELAIQTGNTFPAIYSNALSVWDWYTNRIRPSNIKDITTCIQLVEEIDEIKVACPVCLPHNSPVTNKVLHAICIILENCTKMNKASPHDLSEAVFWKEAIDIADQDLPSNLKPTLIYALSPTNPLQIDPDTCEIFQYLIEHKFPLTISSCPIAGATSPMTMAGTTVQTHAEFLGMLTIAQVLREGIPIVYGGSAGPMDMRTGTLSYGCSERNTMLCANMDIAMFFKIPHFSSSGTIDSPYPDFQAGQSKALAFMTRLMKGTTFGIWFGSLLTGKAVAPEQIILDVDIYRSVITMLQGMHIDEERLAFEAIKRVGPGGNYLMDEHTLSWMRSDEFYTSPIVNHNGVDGKSMVDRAHELVEEIIENCRIKVSDKVQEDLRKLLEKYT